MNLNLTYLEHETPSKHIMKTKISHCALEFQVQTGKGGGSSSSGSSSIGWYSARRAHGLGCVLERTKHRASRASARRVMDSHLKVDFRAEKCARQFRSL